MTWIEFLESYYYILLIIFVNIKIFLTVYFKILLRNKNNLIV